MRYLLCLWLFSYACLAVEENTASEITAPTAASPALIEAILDRASEYAVKSTIHYNDLRGNFGESVMQKSFIRHLGESGNWHSVTPRLGRQGIDGLFLRYKSNGLPDRIMVVESKFGSSRLGHTTDGRQLSWDWTRKRLAGLSGRYRSLSKDLSQHKVIMGKALPSRGARHVISLPLGDTKQSVVFWRENAKGPWHCTGKINDVKKLQTRVNTLSDFLEHGANNQNMVKRYLYQLDVVNNQLVIKVKDAAKLNTTGSMKNLSVKRSFSISLSSQELQRYKTIAKAELTNVIAKKLPHLSDTEIKSFANTIADNTDNLESVLRNQQVRTVNQQIAINSLKWGAVGGGLAATFEGVNSYLATGEVDWERVGKAGVTGFISAGAGAWIAQAIPVWATRSNNLMYKTAQIAGFGHARLGAQVLAGSTGFLVGDLIYAYGGALAGLHDWEMANTMSTISAISVGASTLAYAGVMAYATAFGTASTGAAISSLSGAAATNAAMAWLGGGAVSAGGGGVAAGSAVLGATTAGVGIVIAFVAWQGYDWYNQDEDNNRIEYTLKKLQTLPALQAIPPL